MDISTGDIIAIRNKQGEVHAMVYVTPYHVLSKNGKSRENMYVVWPPESLYSWYGVKQVACKFQVGTPDDYTCPNSWANVYRCRNFVITGG
jgi:hypothetical protein